MSTSAARFAATIAAASAVLIGMGVGATALSRSTADPVPDPTVGDAIVITTTDDAFLDDLATDGATSDGAPTEVMASPSVDDLDDDSGSREDDDSVALPPGDTRLGSVTGADEDDDHDEHEDHEDDQHEDDEHEDD